MTKKREKIAALIEQFREQDLDPHYLAYFDCFNRQLFYEAHEVLEQLWLPQRRGPDGLFYKGLIQLSGAFVHLQKRRLGPATALFKLAQANLGQYPGSHHRLEIAKVLKTIQRCLEQLESNKFITTPSCLEVPPRLELEK